MTASMRMSARRRTSRVSPGGAVLMSMFAPKRTWVAIWGGMKKPLPFGLFGLLVAGHAMGQDGYEPAEWFVDGHVLACSPSSVAAGGSLVLALGPRHGREMAIRRVADNSWYFLVVAMPDEGEPQLMTPAEFALASSVEIPASFNVRTGEGTQQSVLSRPGKYEVYVSDILESETGGHVCRFDYTGSGADRSGA